MLNSGMLDTAFPFITLIGRIELLQLNFVSMSVKNTSELISIIIDCYFHRLQVLKSQANQEKRDLRDFCNSVLATSECKGNASCLVLYCQAMDSVFENQVKTVAPTLLGQNSNSQSLLVSYHQL